jgi:hypothetical protein
MPGTCGTAGDDRQAVLSFWRRVMASSATTADYSDGELVSVAVPSSEGWEDQDDIHWFYGFTHPTTTLPTTTTTTNQHQKDLFVRFPTTAGWDAKDLNASLLALIELGQEVCRCGRVWLVVRRNPDELENLVHTLMYVGFEVDDPAFAYDDERYLMLKLDL